jgi:DNA-binding response OmpR family regulator
MLILVAEDDELILKTIEHRLKKDGHEVIITPDGRDALAKIKECKPDLVITDIMMPYVSGLEIVGTVKSVTDKQIPVIVLSAMGQENVVMEAFELGAVDFITKPFSPNELIVRIKRLSQYPFNMI